MSKKNIDIIETILGPSEYFTLPHQIFNAITFSGFLITLLIFFADNFLDLWMREHSFAFGLVLTVAYIWLYGKSRESGDYKDYTLLYVLLELSIFLQTWFMHGGIVGIALIIALHFVVTISMILEGWKKYALIAMMLFIMSGLFYLEIIYPNIVRSYPEHKDLLVDVFIFFILIGGGIVICNILVMQNHAMQFQRINQINSSLDKSKKDLEEKIKEQNESRLVIKKTLKEKELLLREIHHRVKNNLQIILSLLLLQQDKLKSQSAVEALRTAGSRVQAIALVHELLYRSETLAHIDFESYINELVHFLSDMYQKEKRINVLINIEHVDVSIEEAITCGIVITELITNSFKYAFPEMLAGYVKICLKDLSKGHYEMTILDNGVGIDLGITYKHPNTLGLLLVRELVEGQLNGNIQLIEGIGTIWRVTWRKVKEI